MKFMFVAEIWKATVSGWVLKGHLLSIF